MFYGLCHTFPIGVVNRKGELGSYYSVKDFMGVNPEFGTIEDFKGLLTRPTPWECMLFSTGCLTILHGTISLLVDHPEWYAKDSTGKFTPPIGTDWTDVIQLDWSQKGLQDYMIDAM